MSRWNRQKTSGSRGFTLLESLVALTVLMIALSAIAGLSESSLRTGIFVERHIAEIEKTRQILAALPSRGALANLNQSGEMAGYVWRLDAKPFRADFVDPRAQTRWTPETIVLTVEGPSGAKLSFDMIRLVSAGAK